MTTLTYTAPTTPHHSWFGRIEAWLDARGKGAWIAAMVLGFVFFWPLGLALLFYMIWSKRMFSKSCRHRAGRHRTTFSALAPTGNSAFDAYKADTLNRLEREQRDFETFLERLREAKDKAEFDQFMEDRSRRPAAETPEADLEDAEDRADEADETPQRGTPRPS